MIARWKPVHLGHTAVIESLADRADRLILGIGSSNKYDVYNPFTADETEEMLRLVLGSRIHIDILRVPDLGHGPRWRAMVREMLGPLDLFVTANDYVRNLLTEVYTVVHPIEFVPPERRVRVDGTAVRLAMAQGEDWERMVPESVARFLRERNLVGRFRAEFGPATLARADRPAPDAPPPTAE